MRWNFPKVLLLIMVGAIVIPIIVTFGLNLFGWSRHSERSSIQINVHVTGSGLVSMDLEEYIKGVVAAEMPAEFELEALKAQAVAARTYAVKKMVRFGGPGCDRHPGADICTDYTHDQAWTSFSELKQKYGFISNLRVLAKIDRAVEDTRGIVATYAGVPIDAIYHANSAGVTEDSEKVWGHYIPYLRSVRTNLPAEQRDINRKSFSLSELSTLLGAQISLADLRSGRQLLPGEVVLASTGQGSGLEVLERSHTGRVVYLNVGGRKIRGIDFRSRLGLKSTNFTWTIDGDQVSFMTLGNGHGVGMCQYGANALAKSGKSYTEILAHYYTGIKLQNIQELTR